MASNSAVASSQQHQSQQQQQIFQQPNSQHHCKECGLFFDSGKSLEVHLQYHKENLLTKWATQASQNASGNSGGASDETNNNNTKNNNNKREFNSHANTIAAAADSSDAMINKTAITSTPTSSSNNKSPDSYTSRTTPETSTSFGHPPTPQSYHSAPSPYQGVEANTFSPNYQNYPPIKSERASPLGHYSSSAYPNQMYAGGDGGQYFNMEPHQHQQQLGYPQDYPVHKIPSSQASQGFRYHPYHHPSPYDRSPQVSSSSPAYPSQNPQPTPSPSPKQCDKCGCVCDSAAQLIDHINHAHPPTPAPHMNPFQQQNQHFQFNAEIKTEIKTEDEPQTEILDLDSHKVHQVFQSPEEEESLKRHNGELANLNGPNPHSVSAMLNTWPPPNGSPQQKMFSPPGADHRMFLEQKMFPNGQESKMYNTQQQNDKMFQQDQKLFQPHQMHSPEFGVTNGVTTTSQDSNSQSMGGGPGGYRPFEHIPPQPNPPVISSTQLPNPVPSNNPPVVPSKGANWKSNEARRPKTYNCSACNKWFTSSGHLKRHYNTTLHKNAVKSSGQPDPATLPISAHHHPGREASNRQNDASNQSPDHMDPDSRDDGTFERTQMPGMLQQPPNGPYDRQPAPPNIVGPQPPSLHSPMNATAGGGQQQNPNSLTNLSAGSPPNGDAGPSATNQDLSRGLLSISTPNTPQQITPLSPMVATMSTNNTISSHLTASAQGFNLLNHHHQAAPPPHLIMGMPPSPGDLHHHTHQSPVFQNMAMAPQSSMAASYPNALAPHVTPVTATSSQPPVLTSLTTTGESAYTAEFIQYGLQTTPQYFTPLAASSGGEQQPLPSFAQFQPHRYGLLLAAGYPANVGGMSPVTDSTSQQHHYIQQQQHQHFNQIHQLQQVTFSPVGSPYNIPPDMEARNIIYQDTDGGDYEITVLQPTSYDENSEPSSPQAQMVYSTSTTTTPVTQTNTIYTTPGEQQPPPTKMMKLNPASPIREEIKREYENGSPRITSTGSPLAGKTAPPAIHKCFDCDKMFNKACYLTQHNKTFHSGDKPFKCNRCGKRFPNDDTFQEHLAKHAGDKPFKCELCPKQFNHKTDLRRHMCLHTGQKPYACDHCGKGFIRKDHMLKHAETHSRKTNSNAGKNNNHHHHTASAS